MDWIEFTEVYVLAAMPTDMRTAYDAWVVAHPGKEGRLAEIAGQVLADFRSGLSANPSVVMEADEDLLAERCVPHALTIVFYNLMLEMGLAINMSAQTAFSNAEVYLRRLYESDEILDGAAMSQTPSYESEIEREARLLAGV